MHFVNPPRNRQQDQSMVLEVVESIGTNALAVDDKIQVLAAVAVVECTDDELVRSDDAAVED